MQPGFSGLRHMGLGTSNGTNMISFLARSVGFVGQLALILAAADPEQLKVVCILQFEADLPRHERCDYMLKMKKSQVAEWYGLKTERQRVVQDLTQLMTALSSSANGSALTRH